MFSQLRFHFLLQSTTEPTYLPSKISSTLLWSTIYTYSTVSRKSTITFSVMAPTDKQTDKCSWIHNPAKSGGGSEQEMAPIDAVTGSQYHRHQRTSARCSISAGACRWSRVDSHVSVHVLCRRIAAMDYSCPLYHSTSAFYGLL